MYVFGVSGPKARDNECERERQATECRLEGSMDVRVFGDWRVPGLYSSASRPCTGRCGPLSLSLSLLLSGSTEVNLLDTKAGKERYMRVDGSRECTLLRPGTSGRVAVALCSALLRYLPQMLQQGLDDLYLQGRVMLSRSIPGLWFSAGQGR